MTREEEKVIDALSRAARLSFDDGVFAPFDFLRSLQEDGFEVKPVESKGRFIPCEEVEL